MVPSVYRHKALLAGGLIQTRTGDLIPPLAPVVTKPF